MYDSLRRRFITMSTFEGSGDGPIRKPMTPLHTKMQNMAGMIYTAFMLAGCFFFVFFFICFRKKWETFFQHSGIVPVHVVLLF